MREIKFRAWDKRFKKILSHDEVMQYFKIALENPEYFILMQYTGLKDKNGVEIYESDIVKCKDFKENIGVIRFGEYKANDMSNSYKCGNLGFYVEFNDEFSLLRKDICFWDGLGMEVIGDIYSNPELLEGLR